jgi:hypothetical protein
MTDSSITAAGLAAELAALNAATAPGQPGNTTASFALAERLMALYRAGQLTVAPPATADDVEMVARAMHDVAFPCNSWETVYFAKNQWLDMSRAALRATGRKVVE